MEQGNNRDIILSCRHISKAFGGTQALDDVQFDIARGEVHALLGENGAGKSTLMKIIIGLFKADKGSITFDGEPYLAKDPADAIRKGISMIHQELNPEYHLTIAENIFLKREDVRGKVFLDKKSTNLKAQQILDELGVKLNAKRMIEGLTLAQCQMIEIIKAVSFDAKLIIMDEPTSSLDSEETEALFNMIRRLKSQGVSIVYISHRMDEIFQICDRVTVLRDGRYVGSEEIGNVDREKLISMMVGRTVKNIFPKTECAIGETVLKVENLTGKGFSDISFEVRAGEIVGISGLVGSGRSETMRALIGLDPLTSGKVYLSGKEVRIRSVRHALRLGICMVNEDRKNFGLVLHRSIRENISLPNLRERHRKGLINKRREVRETAEAAQTLTVKAASLELDAYSLSGGNQQKVVLAKWLMSKPKVLILDEPTRGVDVGAKSEIHSLMGRFASEGMAIVMISSELPEIMGISDRILIYREGRLNGEVMRQDILSGKENQETVLAREF